MNESQAQQLIDAVTRQNQLLEGIDWKLWELFKHVIPQEEEEKK